jgi:hypothetical protein
VRRASIIHPSSEESADDGGEQEGRADGGGGDGQRAVEAPRGLHPREEPLPVVRPLHAGPHVAALLVH